MASALAVTEIAINAMGAAAANPTVTVPAGGVPRGAFALIAFVTDSASVETAVTDSQANKWTLIAASAFNASGQRVRAYGAYIATALVSGNVITVTIVSNFLQIQACYIVGQRAGEYLTVRDVAEGNKVNAATATALTSIASGQTLQDDVIVFAVYGFASATATFTPTAPFVQTGLTNKVSSNGFSLATTYSVKSALGNFTPAATLGTTAVYGSLTFVLKAGLGRLLPQPGATQALQRTVSR
jgi:hypothetical protein